MCGIAGFYGFRNDDLIKKISKELEHRGPDGEGYDIEDNVTLMNRRLAIIDVKTGDQPIYNENKSIVIVFVGEIYNYRELTKELLERGHKFRTKSDTEMIVHAYEEWGEASFDRFNGMFTFAIHDKKKKKLILARDHFGIKPLYYAITNNKSQNIKLIFSSEIKPILFSGLIRKKPNDRIIYRYLKYRVHDDNEETFFEGIYRLMPGQMMVIENGKWRMENYSNLEKELLASSHSGERSDSRIRFWASQNDEKSVVKEFKKRLIEAVKLRLISEVPVGSCLSGGLDSSTVVSIVNKLLREKVKEAESVGKKQKTFSAIFPNSANDENRYIDELLKSYKLQATSYKIQPTPEEFFKDMQDFVRTQEEPTISTGPYAQYKVMQLAHRKITVALDGQGSDEMMAGYLPYYFVYLRQLWKEKRYLKLLYELCMSLDILYVQSINRLYILMGLKKGVKLANVLNSKFAEDFSMEEFRMTQNNIKKRLIEDIFQNSLQSLLRYEDRNAMRFSIEGRVPFLDFNLLKYLFSLNTDAIIKNGWNKYILREATKDLLPELINRRRNKIGFTTPEYEWFMRMKNKIYAIFLSESFAKRKYFNQQEVLKAFQLFIEGKVDDTMVFWRMLNLELWLREFFDSVHKVSKVNKVHKEEFEPNEGKKLEIKIQGKRYLRFPVKTDLFKKGDDYASKISDSVLHYINIMKSDKKYKKLFNKKFFVVVSEKIVAIAQGRSYFIWDIHPGIFAKILSKYVTKTPAGIGLGSPWTMQIAIREVGVIRVFAAAIIAAIAKPFGARGIFYRITGDTIRSIDGPTEYSLYPSNVSAKLGPKEPKQAAMKIDEAIRHSGKRSASRIRFWTSQNDVVSNFLGVVIIDANDLGQNVLGNSTGLNNALIEQIFEDNPMGQADEQTPIVIVFKK